MDLDVPMTQELLDAEAAWAGSLPGSNDHEAGDVVGSLPGYDEYRRVLQEKLRDQVGDEFPMYRAMTRDGFERWQAGESQGPSGFTLNADFARAWGRFSTVDGESLVVVRVLMRPEWILMRGKPEDQELVADADAIVIHDVEVL